MPPCRARLGNGRKSAFETANWLATLLLLRSLVAALTGGNLSENKWEIPPAGAVTPVTALQTLGLFAVPTGYIFISCTETGYNPINTGVL